MLSWSSGSGLEMVPRPLRQDLQKSWPISSLYWSVGQTLQWTCPGVAEYCPTVHCLHCVMLLPSSECWPAGQSLPKRREKSAKHVFIILYYIYYYNMTVSFIVSKVEQEKKKNVKVIKKTWVLKLSNKKGRNIFTYTGHWCLRFGTRREGRLCDKCWVKKCSKDQRKRSSRTFHMGMRLN